MGERLVSGPGLPPAGKRPRGVTVRLKALAALGLVLLMAGCASQADGPVTDFRENNPDGLHAAVLPQPYRMPDVSLEDTGGEPFDVRTDLDRPLTLVFFGYTHCPDICLVIMADIAAAVTRLDEADKERVGMLFITSDPARDDAKTLRTYLDRYNPSFEGLTGSLADIVQVGKALGVAIEKGDKLPSGGYAVAHGTQVVGVLQDGSAPLVWTQGTTSAQMASDISTVLADGVPSVTPNPGADS